jgi:hypothetical protein
MGIVRNFVSFVTFLIIHLLNIRFEAGAVGAASRCGSGSTIMMRLRNIAKSIVSRQLQELELFTKKSLPVSSIQVYSAVL